MLYIAFCNKGSLISTKYLGMINLCHKSKKSYLLTMCSIRGRKQGFINTKFKMLLGFILLLTGASFAAATKCDLSKNGQIEFFDSNKQDLYRAVESLAPGKFENSEKVRA